jgi:phage-related protein
LWLEEFSSQEQYEQKIDGMKLKMQESLDLLIDQAKNKLTEVESKYAGVTEELVTMLADVHEQQKKLTHVTNDPNLSTNMKNAIQKILNASATKVERVSAKEVLLKDSIDGFTSNLGTIYERLNDLFSEFIKDLNGVANNISDFENGYATGEALRELFDTKNSKLL